MRHSTTIPVVLTVTGVIGALACLGRFIGLLIGGDLAWEESALGFACFCMLAAIGAQELMATDLHESGESSGF
jgi:branched-subunit amino acid transport protein